jgi:hypothetical protein
VFWRRSEPDSYRIKVRGDIGYLLVFGLVMNPGNPADGPALYVRWQGWLFRVIRPTIRCRCRCPGGLLLAFRFKISSIKNQQMIYNLSAANSSARNVQCSLNTEVFTCSQRRLYPQVDTQQENYGSTSSPMRPDSTRPKSLNQYDLGSRNDYFKHGRN